MTAHTPERETNVVKITVIHERIRCLILSEYIYTNIYLLTTQMHISFVCVFVNMGLNRPQFLERMQLEYHTKALDRGVYVIGSCGFDSVPADLGVLYTQRQFKGRKLHDGLHHESTVYQKSVIVLFNEEAIKAKIVIG